MDRRSLDHRLSTESIDMKIIFYSHANKTHFHQNCFALGPVLEVGVQLDLDVRSNQKTGFFRFPQSIGSICFLFRLSALD